MVVLHIVDIFDAIYLSNQEFLDDALLHHFQSQIHQTKHYLTFLIWYIDCKELSTFHKFDINVFGRIQKGKYLWKTQMTNERKNLVTKNIRKQWLFHFIPFCLVPFNSTLWKGTLDPPKPNVIFIAFHFGLSETAKNETTRYLNKPLFSALSMQPQIILDFSQCCLQCCWCKRLCSGTF